MNDFRKAVNTLEPARKKLTLKRLLASIRPENVHAEVDWGKPKGKEVW
jgi:antitoxin component of MazEF toxin-antitoxin module